MRRGPNIKGICETCNEILRDPDFEDPEEMCAPCFDIFVGRAMKKMQKLDSDRQHQLGIKKGGETDEKRRVWR